MKIYLDLIVYSKNIKMFKNFISMKKKSTKMPFLSTAVISKPEFDSGYIIEIILCSHVPTRTKYLQNMCPQILRN